MQTPFSKTLRSLNSTRSKRMLFMLLAVIFVLGSWLLWFFFSKLTIYEISDSARLEVDASIYPIEAPLDGKIVKTNLPLGKEVKQGDFLIQLDARNEELQLAVLQAKRNALKEEIDALKKELKAVENASIHDERAVSEGIEEAKARFAEAGVVLKFSKERFDRLSMLHKNGQIPELDVLKARSEQEKQKASANVLYRALVKAEQSQNTDKSNRKARIERLLLEQVKSVGELTIITATIDKMQHDIDTRMIKAQASGRIAETSGIEIGSIVKAGDRLGSIIPNDKLKAVAYFKPSKAIGRIHKTQTGSLNIEGFPWAQYGSLTISVNIFAYSCRFQRMRPKR